MRPNRHIRYFESVLIFSVVEFRERSKLMCITIFRINFTGETGFELILDQNKGKRKCQKKKISRNVFVRDPTGMKKWILSLRKSRDHRSPSGDPTSGTEKTHLPRIMLNDRTHLQTSIFSGLSGCLGVLWFPIKFLFPTTSIAPTQRSTSREGNSYEHCGSAPSAFWDLPHLNWDPRRKSSNPRPSFCSNTCRLLLPMHLTSLRSRCPSREAEHRN